MFSKNGAPKVIIFYVLSTCEVCTFYKHFFPKHIHLKIICSNFLVFHKKYIFVPLFYGRRKQSADEFFPGVEDHVIPLFIYVGLTQDAVKIIALNNIVFLKKRIPLHSNFVK